MQGGGNASKRAKASHEEEVEWMCTFDQTNGLRTMSEVVGNILTNINFRLTNKDGVCMLCVDSIDPQQVCMVQARLSCETVVGLRPGEVVDFCVNSKLLNLCLQGVPPHCSIDVSKRRGSPDIHVRAYEAPTCSYETVFTLPTLIDESETMQLSDMSYEYTVEIDLGTLRQIVKMSQSLQAKHINLSVGETAARAADGVRTRIFTIGATGDAKQEHAFASVLQDSCDQSDTRIIRAVTDASAVPAMSRAKLEHKYADSFSTTYLNQFLSKMERQVITMKLSNDQPLVLHYPLSADASRVIFVLAPKNDDAD
jgi:hypothetical protein